MIFQYLVPPLVIALLLGPLAILAIVLTFTTWRSGTGWKWLLRLAMVLCLGWIALRPTVADTRMGAVRSNVDVFFVVDRTGSMAAEDYNPSDGSASPRLDGVRHDVESIVADLPGARFSIIGFDSSATTGLPLTTDARAVTAWAQTVTQELSLYSSGSSIDRPHDALAKALSDARDRTPEDVRLVFFLSDGEQTVETEPESFADMAADIDGGAVLGYGTSQGGEMKRYLGPSTDEDPGYIMDPSKGSDAPAVSVIDEQNLQALAEQLGVPYEHRTVPDSTAFLTDGLDFKAIADDGRAATKYFIDWFWPAVVVLGLLLCWQAFDFMRSAVKPTRPVRELRASSTRSDPQGGRL